MVSRVPIHFEVSRSKVKVTVAIYAKTVSVLYLEQFISDSHSLGRKIGHGQ